MAPANSSLEMFFHPNKDACVIGHVPLRQAVVARVKAMGLPPGMDAAHVAQALGEGRGSQADLVVAVMETKGAGRVDFYEVSKFKFCCMCRYGGSYTESVRSAIRVDEQMDNAPQSFDRSIFPLLWNEWSRIPSTDGRVDVDAIFVPIQVSPSCPPAFGGSSLNMNRL